MLLGIINDDETDTRKGFIPAWKSKEVFFQSFKLKTVFFWLKEGAASLPVYSR